MDGYYNNQISTPYFKGAVRQRGSGLGALAASIGRVAIPLFKNVLFPTAKRFTQDLAIEALPELVNVVEGKSKIKKAAKQSIKKFVRKHAQRGRGGKISKASDKIPLIPPSPKKKTKNIKKLKGIQRSRYDILGKLKA